MTIATIMGATPADARPIGVTRPGATRTVSDDEADIRLDRWFRRHFPGVPQSALQKLCRTGQVRVDCKCAAAATRLASGQPIRVPPLPEPTAQKPITDADPSATREIEAMILY